MQVWRLHYKIWNWQVGCPREPICTSMLNLKAWESEKSVVWFAVWELTGFSPSKNQCFNSSSKPRKDQCTILKQSSRRSSILLIGGFAFCSVQAFILLDEAHYTKYNLMFSGLLIQMLTSAQKTLTDTPRIMFEQIFEYPVAQSSWHIKINHLMCYALSFVLQ